MAKIGKLEYVVFIGGFSVMVVEIIGSRLVAPYFGNTIFVWTSLIGMVLASLALGYHLGGKIADKNAEMRTLFYLLLGSGILIAAIPLISDAVLKFSLILGVRYGPLLSSLILISIPNVLLGMVSPYAVKLKTKDLDFLGSNAGDLYAISTVGSIVGTFITGFFLIPTFGVKTILIGTGLILGISGFIALGKTSYKLSFLFFLLIVVNIFALVLPKDNEIVYEKESPYQLIRVQDIPERNVRYLYLDNAVHSGIFLNSTNIVFRYIKCSQIARLISQDPENVLFVGLGGGTGINEYFVRTDAKVDAVEIDADVVETAYDYFNLTRDERVSVFAEDGRNFISSSNKEYDIVFMDAFSSYSIPFHLTTLETTKEIKRTLKPDGILVTNVISGLDGNKSLMFKSLYKTYKEVFPYVYVFHIFDEPGRVQNVILIASSKNISELFEGVDFKGEFSCIPYSQEIDISDAVLLSDDYAPVDNLVISTYE
ncbi:fused MFS/spermidine synthase [Candidatus Micrarchaeota archaeon]|nr:fused MFS/spermidine synthase [Candidatus Micrarchaeota archaeon]